MGHVQDLHNETETTVCTFFCPVSQQTCFWCLVVTQTMPISLYMDICIFNFKVTPQCVWSLRLNIIRSSWAVSNFSLLSERQVEQRGGGRGRRDNTQSWINHLSTFDPNEEGGCFWTSVLPLFLLWPRTPPPSHSFSPPHDRSIWIDFMCPQSLRPTSRHPEIEFSVIEEPPTNCKR